MELTIDKDEVLKNLNNYILNTLPENIQKALQDTGLFVQGEARENCNNQFKYPTGQLAGSIDFQNDDKTVTIYTPHEYGIYVEKGTGIYAQGSSSAKKIPWVYPHSNGKFYTSYGRPATPFLEPAVMQHTQEIQDIFIEDLKP